MFFFGRGYYRHAGPTDAEEIFSCVRSSSVGQECLILHHSGSGDPELQALGHAGVRGGQAPALQTRKGFSSHALFGIGRSRTTVFCASLANLVNLVNPAHLLLIVLGS